MNQTTLPLIDIWYGPHQVFGQLGLSQRWVNILGRVHRPDEMVSLHYTLNDGPSQPLSLGPDRRRLAASGDFNVEIDHTQLKVRDNTVMITATTPDGDQISESVVVHYVSGNTWPLPFSVDWNEVTAIQDVAQVVDGLWSLDNGALYPVDNSYDRVIAIGDVSWRDYEITVPVTIYGFNACAYQYPSIAPVIGFVVRWQGHYQWGSDDHASGQPRYGFAPCGALGLYGWSNERGRRLNIVANDGSTVIADDTSGFQMKLGVPYVMKMRVQSRAGTTSLYSLKAWEQDQPEPSGWSLSAEGRIGEHSQGSIVLLSHHTAAAFGNISIAPV